MRRIVASVIGSSLVPLLAWAVYARFVPEEGQDAEALRRAEFGRGIRAIEATDAVQHSIAKGDTLVWDTVLSNDTYQAICVVYTVWSGQRQTEYRAVHTFEGLSFKDSDWNAKCVGQKLTKTPWGI